MKLFIISMDRAYFTNIGFLGSVFRGLTIVVIYSHTTGTQPVTLNKYRCV